MLVTICLLASEFSLYSGDVFLGIYTDPKLCMHIRKKPKIELAFFEITEMCSDLFKDLLLVIPRYLAAKVKKKLPVLGPFDQFIYIILKSNTVIFCVNSAIK